MGDKMVRSRTVLICGEKDEKAIATIEDFLTGKFVMIHALCGSDHDVLKKKIEISDYIVLITSFDFTGDIDNSEHSPDFREQSRIIAEYNKQIIIYDTANKDWSLSNLNNIFTYNLIKDKEEDEKEAKAVEDLQEHKTVRVKLHIRNIFKHIMHYDDL
jgi:hypothetical protein